LLNFASAKFKKTPHYDEQIHFIVFTRPFYMLRIMRNKLSPNSEQS